MIFGAAALPAAARDDRRLQGHFTAGRWAQRGKSGAMHDAGPRGAQVFSHRGCQSEALQELAQDWGFGMEKPISVQVALHGHFPLPIRIVTGGGRPALRDHLHTIDFKGLRFLQALCLC